MEKLYKLVVEMQKEAISALRAGAPLSALPLVASHVRLAIVNARSDLSRLLVTGDYSGHGNRGGGGASSGVLDLEGMSDANVLIYPKYYLLFLFECFPIFLVFLF